ncbi:MAG: hypothetical protein H0T79_04560 [Deltaproteobacteria bacterium]|nr:hypothetical protein [Deltaproteobacteria bacterium]
MTSSAIDDLYQQVYARPHDDDLRRVLADALLAIDDPRGELIQLQFHPDADHQQRAMRLVQQYGLTWLGALRGAVIPLAYERGFLASCQVLDVSPTLVGHPEWGTVYTIELDPDPATRTSTFFVHPVMRALRRVTGANVATLRWLATQTLPPLLTELATECTWAEFQTVFDELSRLPLQVIEVAALQVVLRRGADGAWVTPAELPDLGEPDPEDPRYQ